MTKRLTIGVTEPSQFTNECIFTIEEFFDANPIKICQNKIENLEDTLSRCDGVILAGGVDIHPRIYGENVTNDQGFSRFDIERDYREVKVFSYCQKHKIPILGICRGHQFIGVLKGAIMVQDLGRSVLCHQPKNQSISADASDTMHYVELTAAWQNNNHGFNFKDAEKKKKSDAKIIHVNSFHHQGLLVEDCPTSITVLGTAIGNKDDQIIELMCGDGWISCQWHPEYDWRFNSTSHTIFDVFAEMLKK